MRKTILPVLLQLALFYTANAQVFPVDTLQYRGDINKYINIVILGDGYTAGEQGKFASDAAQLSTYLFGQSPWSNYTNYFNVFAIQVVSTQSGTKHPNTSSDCSSASPQVPVSNPDTYFGCSFDSYGIHRLVVANKVSNIVDVLAANFPVYDQVLIIANSPYYGGSGGVFATSTTETASNEITAHELGHSFAYLADEYYAGDNYALEKPNMTKESNPALVKWKNWVGANGIGVFQHCCGGNSASWYKPYNACKMQALNLPYCSVCSEALVEKIHALVNPIAAYTPQSATVNSPGQLLPFRLTELMKPTPNTLKINWKLDGTTIAGNIDSVIIDQNTLSNGAHNLSATVTDTTALLRVDGHTTLHLSTVNWTINKTTSGVQVQGDAREIACTVYPNPASERLYVSVESARPGLLSVRIQAADGKTVLPLTRTMLVNGRYEHSFDISQLNTGMYYLLFDLGGIVHTQPFLKQ